MQSHFAQDGDPLYYRMKPAFIALESATEHKNRTRYLKMTKIDLQQD